MEERKIKQGDIYYADLPTKTEGSVQAGRRPVLITQCNELNKNSTTYIVAAITSKLKRLDYKFHVLLPRMKGLPKQSMVLAEQRMTVSKDQLIEYRCSVHNTTMKKVYRAIAETEHLKRKNLFRHRKRKGKYK